MKYTANFTVTTGISVEVELDPDEVANLDRKQLAALVFEKAAQAGWRGLCHQCTGGAREGWSRDEGDYELGEVYREDGNDDFMWDVTRDGIPSFDL